MLPRTLFKTFQSQCSAILLFLTFLMVLFGPSAFAAPLSLDAYLSQVNGQNQEIASAKQSSEGAGLRSAEAGLNYSPTLFAETQWISENFRNALLQTAYQKLGTDNYTVGVRQKTPWGLSAALSYDINKISYINGVDFSTGLTGTRRFFEATPKLELSVSLWRNLFGGETQAQVEATRSGALASQYMQSFQVKATRSEAEGVYIRLVSARQLMAVYQDTMTYAQDLLNFSQKQVRLNLGENADLLQAQANYEIQKLNLQSAIDEERTASRDFNRLRQIDSDKVEETVSLPDMAKMTIPARADVRDDVRAAQEQAKGAAAAAKMGFERNRPNLEIYGSYALNARDGQFSDAFANSWKPGQETSMIGIRFSMPLAWGLRTDATKGFAMEEDAANTMVAQRTFEQEVEWKDLVQQFNEAKKRYEIADALAKIQKRKVENERLRLKRGRTTTYQTLTFTQDYNMSEAARVQAQSRVLNILARMKTFAADEQSANN